MKRFHPLILLVFLVIIIAGGARAELQVKLEGTVDSLLFGSPLDLRLRVVAPAEGRIFLPNWGEVLHPFELLAKPESTSSASENRQRQTDINLKVTCYQTGLQVLPPIPVRWISADSARMDSAATDPVIINIQGVVPDSILALADSTQKPYRLLRPNREKQLGFSFAEIAPWLLGIIAALGAFFLLRWLLRRRKKKSGEIELGPPPRPAHEIALEELDKLRDRRLYQAGRIKEYYSELSTIIRKYIEARFGIPALESTTFQLLRDIESQLGDENLQSVLENLLADADLAKFAKHQPDGLICQRDLEKAYVLVKKTMPRIEPLAAEEAA